MFIPLFLAQGYESRNLGPPKQGQDALRNSTSDTNNAVIGDIISKRPGASIGVNVRKMWFPVGNAGD